MMEKRGIKYLNKMDKGREEEEEVKEKSSHTG